MGIIGRFVELPKPIPRARGPFALSDLDYLRELLERGGLQPWEGLQPVGGPGATPEEATNFVFDAMGLGEWFRQSRPKWARRRGRRSVRCLLAITVRREFGCWRRHTW